jgi:uncharacterized protein (DUF2252 family)
MASTPFNRDPQQDCEGHRELVLRAVTGTHRFFRMSGPRMQHVFADLIDHSKIPKILIHGNPHVANYCKTKRGAAMADFDRSRIGPYAYDLVRFLISISLSRDVQDTDFLHPIILEQFKRGYLTGFDSQATDFAEMYELKTTAPKKWQTSTNSYLDSGKKWAKKLAANETKITKRLTGMLSEYLENRGELKLLERHQLKRCAEVAGSMGKLHHLYLLEDRRNKRDAMLIDIKEVYEEKDTEWYTNPFEHHGKRMNAAGDIYAPDWEQRPGHTSYKGQQYWVRQIPTQQIKITIPLNELDQCDLCYAVGSQLGRGHAKAASKTQHAQILGDLEQNFDGYVQAATQMRDQVITARQQYCKAVLKRGFVRAAK